MQHYIKVIIMYDDHMNLCKLYMLQFRNKFFVKTVIHFNGIKVIDTVEDIAGECV